ncbi:MAG: SDR family NAD(P)-dependent oxidoreductase [Anaerolineae bacterium]|nr:SDR family NAD(P)-dependent oxidoreductase [Candidatus Roseilinea sp.]MDW8450172.1 SDR family NAD(P)-dependent oxidoreductase [Anaerolineae bacterium]
MARIFITGSADGLGQLAASALVAQGHEVVLHARNPERARHARQQAPGAVHALVGDLSDVEEIKRLAEEANASGPFDAVIHNAGVYRAPAREVFIVNTLAPYILTCLMQKPKRLIYLSSGMHLQGRADLERLARDQSRVSYSDSKLYVTMLCMAVARRWPGVYANAVDPGWVPTKMGGPNAPDDLHKGYETQVWLAVSDDSAARVSGRYFHHRQARPYNPQAGDVALQERLLNICGGITGVPFPEPVSSDEGQRLLGENP